MLCLIDKELASRADQRVLRWLMHVERMDDCRMARRVLIAKVSGGRVRGTPRLGWMDGVKVALDNKGMKVEKDRKAWRALVHIRDVSDVKISRSADADAYANICA